MIRSQRRVRVPVSPRTVMLDDFSRGINAIDDPAALPAGFVPDGFNVNHLGRRLVARWGAQRLAALASSASYIFYSQALNRVIVQRGTTIYAYETVGWTATSLVTVASSLKVQAVDFNGQVVLATVSGIYTTDGTAVGTVLRAGSVIGCKVAVWQNKVWATTGRTLYWSAAGDATSWTTGTDFTAIREPDDTNIEALGAGNGIDVLGRTGLLVWKRNSRHRVVDSETGEYVTLGVGPGAGANGNEAVATVGGTVYFGNDLGVFRQTGEDAVLVSDAISPFWLAGGGSDVILGNSQDRLVACRGEDIWELYENGAWWRHRLWNGSANKSILSIAPRAVTDSLTPAYILDSDGTGLLEMWRRPDDRAAGTTDKRFDYSTSTPTSRFVLPWVGFGLEMAQVQRAVIHGWGSFLTPYRRIDYDDTLTALSPATLNIQASTASLNRSGTVEVFGIGACRALALQLDWVGGLDFDWTGPDGTPWSWPGAGIAAVRVDVVPLK